MPGTQKLPGSSFNLQPQVCECWLKGGRWGSAAQEWHKDSTVISCEH